MKLELTKEELDLITQLIDLGVKTAGLQAVRPELLSAIDKFSAAIRNANKPKEDTLDG
jgi:hypothetical protein